MLRHRCILGDPQRQVRGAKSELVPKKGEQNQKWMPHPCLLGGPKEGGNATSPLHSQGSLEEGTKSELAPSPLPSRGPKRGQACYVTPAFSGVPKRGDKIRIGCLTPAFSGAETPSAGGELEVVPSPLPSRGPKRGRNCYATPAFSGVPKEGNKHGRRLVSAKRPLRAVLNKKKSGSLKTAMP